MKTPGTDPQPLPRKLLSVFKLGVFLPTIPDLRVCRFILERLALVRPEIGRDSNLSVATSYAQSRKQPALEGTECVS